MKRAHSRLIKSFLTNVDRGLVVGREDSSGPEILRQMVAALQDILNGEDTDTALHIERQAGGPRNWKTVALALLIHEHRKNKVNWAAVEASAKE